MTPLVVQTTAKIASGARHIAPRGDHLSGNRKPRPGQHLEATIDTELQVSEKSVVGRVVARSNYSMTIHQGSKRHVIRSRDFPYGFVSFYWPRAQRYRFKVNGRMRKFQGKMRPTAANVNLYAFYQVNHPGNKRRVRFLTTPMVFYGRAAGFKVSTVGVGELS